MSSTQSYYQLHKERYQQQYREKSNKQKEKRNESISEFRENYWKMLNENNKNVITETKVIVGKVCFGFD